jgi:hypothetical protein
MLLRGQHEGHSMKSDERTLMWATGAADPVGSVARPIVDGIEAEHVYLSHNLIEYYVVTNASASDDECVGSRRERLLDCLGELEFGRRRSQNRVYRQQCM